jgi:hypothetical protein
MVTRQRRPSAARRTERQARGRGSAAGSGSMPTAGRRWRSAPRPNTRRTRAATRSRCPRPARRSCRARRCHPGTADNRTRWWAAGSRAGRDGDAAVGERVARRRQAGERHQAGEPRVRARRDVRLERRDPGVQARELRVGAAVAPADHARELGHARDLHRERAAAVALARVLAAAVEHPGRELVARYAASCGLATGRRLVTTAAPHRVADRR